MPSPPLRDQFRFWTINISISAPSWVIKDFEIREFTPVLFLLHIDMSYPGQGRSGRALPLHKFYLGILTFNYRLHSSLRRIPHPTRQVEGLGRVEGPGAEGHSLDKTGD